MIGCETSTGVEYITKIEDFRELMNENVYIALVDYLNQDKFQYQDKIDDLVSELGSLQEDYDMLDSQLDESNASYEILEEKYDKLKSFYDYFKD